MGCVMESSMGRGCKSHFLRIGFGLVLCLCGVTPALGQRPTGPARQPSQPSPFADMDQPLTLLVSVRELNGSPLESSATVHLSNQLGNQNLTRPTQEASTASFPNVRGGDYEIEVEASGYKPAHE